MAYATVEQLGLRFGSEITELLDRDGDDVEDAQVAAAILDDVSAEIDAILSVRYTVPIASAPLLVSVCCDLARYRLYDDAAPEIVKERQAQAIARIKAIAKGEGELLNADYMPIAERQDDRQDGGATFNQPRDRIFTDTALKGFMGP